MRPSPALVASALVSGCGRRSVGGVAAAPVAGAAEAGGAGGGAVGETAVSVNLRPGSRGGGGGAAGSVRRSAAWLARRCRGRGRFGRCRRGGSRRRRCRLRWRRLTASPPRTVTAKESEGDPDRQRRGNRRRDRSPLPGLDVLRLDDRRPCGKRQASLYGRLDDRRRRLDVAIPFLL